MYGSNNEKVFKEEESFEMLEILCIIQSYEWEKVSYTSDFMLFSPNEYNHYITIYNYFKDKIWLRKT